MTEDELVAALDHHDQLIVKCAQGEITFQQFLAAYRNFYDYWALDGHESDAEERQMLARHARRIDVHRRITEEIFHHLCDDDDANRETYKQAGFFGSEEGLARLRPIADEVGKVRQCQFIRLTI